MNPAAAGLFEAARLFTLSAPSCLKLEGCLKGPSLWQGGEELTMCKFPPRRPHTQRAFDQPRCTAHRWAVGSMACRE